MENEQQQLKERKQIHHFHSIKHPCSEHFSFNTYSHLVPAVLSNITRWNDKWKRDTDLCFVWYERTNGKNSIMYWNRWHFDGTHSPFEPFAASSRRTKHKNNTTAHRKVKKFNIMAHFIDTFVTSFHVFLFFFHPVLGNGLFCRSFNRTV